VGVCVSAFGHTKEGAPPARGPTTWLSSRQGKKEEAMISISAKFQRSKVFLVLSCLCLVAVLNITGCTATSSSQAPNYEPESAEPASSLEPTTTVEALVVPTEGRIGEFITVKVRVIAEEICVLSLSQSIEGTTGIVNYKLGQAYPDDDLVVTWYSQIPSDLKPGSYLLRIEQIPAGQVAGNYVFSQGFIVKY